MLKPAELASPAALLGYLWAAGIVGGTGTDALVAVPVLGSRVSMVLERKSVQVSDRHWHWGC